MRGNKGEEINVTGREGPLKIGVTFIPESAKWPLSLKVLLCSSGPEFKSFGEYQPVLVRDRNCADFLNPQKCTIPLQVGDQGPALSIELLKGSKARGSGESALASFERDPNYSNRPPFQQPKGFLLLK
jgi:hypothetical protein